MAKIFDIIGETIPADKKIRVNKIPVSIKTTLSVDDYASCIYTVANSCFDDNGTYRPEYEEIAKRYAYLKYFTDIDLDGITVEALFETSQAGWYNTIISAIEGTPIYSEIEWAIGTAINSRKQTSFDKLCSDVSAIITKDNTENLADIKAVLEMLGKVDKDAFVDTAVKQAVEKNKVGEEGGKKS